MSEPNYKGFPVFYNRNTGTGAELITDGAEISDGFHTFEELYDHRCLLLCCWISTMSTESYDGQRSDFRPWKSRCHEDGSSFAGWFIVGMTLDGRRGGQISYHLPDKFWDICPAEELERGKKWDGHTAADVAERLKEWLSQ